jgi:hypothetical protein
MLGVWRSNFGYKKRSQKPEARIQNSEWPGARPCAKTQLRRDAAPFDSKSMPFLQQYDSMGISFHGLLGIQISQGPSGAESPGAGTEYDCARSGVDRPPRDGSHHPHPPVQFIVHLL